MSWLLVGSSARRGSVYAVQKAVCSQWAAFVEEGLEVVEAKASFLDGVELVVIWELSWHVFGAGAAFLVIFREAVLLTCSDERQ